MKTHFRVTLRIVVAAMLSLFVGSIVAGQIIDTPDDEVAGIPVNYTESKVGNFDLPDPLTLENGEKVTNASIWRDRRRPEIFRMIEENQFGRVPGRPADLHFDLFDTGTPAFDGTALRKQVTIHFAAGNTGPYLDLLIYLPAHFTAPVPILLQLGWGPNNLTVEDPGVKVGRAWNRKEKRRVPADAENRRRRGVDVTPFLERGFGFAVFNYSDVDPDALDAVAHGVRQLYLNPGKTEPAADEWGSIAAWGWGASRALDYFETDPDVDASRVALTGASRLGKTALWAAARDERIAAVIASVSGEGGAALSRRNYGETVAHLTAPTRYPYQFARNYQDWAGRMADAPFDAHFILALIAPRAVLLQTGNTDKWSDPYGEFLAAKAATPVFELLGEKGIEEYSLPSPGTALMNKLGYLMHDGGHGVMPEDQIVFLDFLEKHLANDR